MIEKKQANKKPSDLFWLMFFFSIILTLLSGVASCFLIISPGIATDLVTPDYKIRRLICNKL